MPIYSYIAKSSPTQKIKGEIEAETEQDAINKISQKGLFPISVLTKGLAPVKNDILSFNRIPNRDVVMFTRQLASLVDSGVNIVNALSIVSGQTSNNYLKSILNDVSYRIKDGKSLSQSMSSHAYVFGQLYTSMIHSGETSGTLDKTLSRLADFLEKEEEFKNSIRSALTYPVFVLAVGVLTIIILLVFVIPRLVKMFEDMGQVLPLPTKILINISGFLNTYWWLLLAGVITLIFLLRRIYHNPQGRLGWDAARLKLPLLGAVTLKTEVSRISRTLSLQLSSGIGIVPALDVAYSVLGNQLLKAEIKRFKDQIISGSSFSASLKTSKLFPDFMTNIVSIGEETGSLDKALARVADDYEKEVDSLLKNLARMVEPIIILFVGLVVGFIVVSMLLPIFQINLLVK
ncbi:MAG: type II secretion system F family protein [Candidatus Omnitrophica bacterium]|nr:type II secretion system F family protein [Candidatus Omnitrophota bacterium]